MNQPDGSDSSSPTTPAQSLRVLALSTTAFTLMFAVWLMFGVLSIPIRKEFGLSEIEFGWLTAIAILNGSVWRLTFGLWTDRFGGRRVLALLVATTAIPAFLVSYYVVVFGAYVALSVWLPRYYVDVFGMGLGKAAVYKHIPEYFPRDVGAVGGLVGLFGALGGFFLPLLFAYSFKATGIPQTTFAILFLVTLASAVWMHLVVMKIFKQATPHLAHVFETQEHALPKQP